MFYSVLLENSLLCNFLDFPQMYLYRSQSRLKHSEIRSDLQFYSFGCFTSLDYNHSL